MAISCYVSPGVLQECCALSLWHCQAQMGHELCSGRQGQQCAGTYTKAPTQAGTWTTFLFKPPYSGSAARAKFNLGDSAIKNSAEEKISALGAKGMRTYRKSRVQCCEAVKCWEN